MATLLRSAAVLVVAFQASSNGTTGRSVVSSSTLVGHWTGDVNRDGKIWRVELDVGVTTAGLWATMDTPDDALYAMPVDTVRLDGGKVHVAVIDFDGWAVTIDATLDGNAIDGTWTMPSPALSVPLALRRTHAAPLRLPMDEVRFRAGDVMLAGTLVKPATPGPYPALVLTHGSGRQTRAVSRYWSQAQLFAKHGVATLIYDRRGQGASQGDSARNLSLALLAEDAVAAVHFLQTRRDVVKARVGVGGFSQGGWVAPMAAAQSRDVAFVLIGSAPGVSINEQNAFNVESVLRNAGAPPETIAQVLALRRRIVAYGEGGPDDTLALRREIDRWRSDSLFRHMLLGGPLERFSAAGRVALASDPADTWRRVTVPVLSVWGELDAAVPAAKSEAVFRRALHAAGNDRYVFRVFPQSGHGNRYLRPRGAPWDWPRLSPGCQELMTTWLREVTRR